LIVLKLIVTGWPRTPAFWPGRAALGATGLQTTPFNRTRQV